MNARFDGLHATLGIAGVAIPEAQVQTVDACADAPDVPDLSDLDRGLYLVDGVAVFRDDVSHILASWHAAAASTASAHSLRVQ